MALYSALRALRYLSETRCGSLPSTCLESLAPAIFKPGLCLISLRGIKRQANEVRTGMMLDLEGRLYQVLKAEHTVGRGRQLGNVQFELRDMLSKNKQQERRRPSDMVEVVRLDSKQYQYLYTEEGQVQLMSPETYEQTAVPEHLFGDAAAFLVPDVRVTVSFAEDGQSLSGELPPTVELRVSEADAYARGDSATSSYKQCTLESGAKLAVPPFVQSGDTVIVDTRTGSFVKRA